MRAVALSALVVMTATAAVAAPPAALQKLSEGGRYQLMEINDKVVRLDTETGGFDLCRMDAGAWRCEVAKDERRELNDRIAALDARVSRLEQARAAEQAAKAEAVARAASQNGKGLVARLYDYVPEIGW